MPAHLEGLPPPVDSRIEILEATPEVLEVRFHPPGWKRSMTWGLAVRFALLAGFGLYLAVVLTNVWTNSAGDVMASDLFIPAGLGCLYLGVLAFYAWDCYRQAEEWTILRVEGRLIRVRHPSLFRNVKQKDLSVNGAETFPTERYAERHQLLFRIDTRRRILFYTPLNYRDARWLIDEINRRIAAPEEDHAGPS